MPNHYSMQLPHAQPIPPPGLFRRLRFYSKKYGVLHALCRYWFSNISRKGWAFVGPFVTLSYLKQWKRSSLKLINLGGGGNCLVGCLTADVDPRSDVYVNLTRALPFEDQSIDGIFCEEAIEHVDKREGLALLYECYRILRPGGVLRITTPDLDYLAAQISATSFGADELNNMFYEHGHRYLYSAKELETACLSAGFKAVIRSSYRDFTACLGYLDSHADRFKHRPELAQYLEAHK